MTRYPLTLAGVGVFVLLTVIPWAGHGAAAPIGWVLAVLGAAILVFGLIRLRGKGGCPRQLPVLALAMLSAAIGLLRYHTEWQARVQPYQDLAGQTVSARVQVMDYPQEQYGRFYYPARVISPADQPFSILLVSSLPLECRPYDLLGCDVKFYRFDESGVYSTMNTQLANGRVLGAYVSGPVSAPAPSTVWWPGRILTELRNDIARQLDRYMPAEEAGLIKRLLLNKRSGLSVQAQSHFREIGCSHMLAASGLHMAVIAAMVSLAVGRLRFGLLGRNALKAGILFLYLCLIGFPVSAMRSYIMVFLYLLLESFGRRMAAVNSLGAAALFICLVDPFSAGDVSFALSFTATLGILLVQRPLLTGMLRLLSPLPRLKGFLRPVLAGLTVTLSAILLTLPIQLFYFGGLPLMAPLANLLLAPFFAPLMVLSAAAPVISWFYMTAWLGEPCMLLTCWTARIVLWLAETLAALPGIYITPDQCGWLVLILSAVLLCRYLGLLPGLKTVRRATALAAVAFWLTLAAADYLLGQEQLTVAVAGNAGAPCVLLVQNHRAAVLSLGGYNSSTANRLLTGANGWAVESVFLPVRDTEARAMAVDLLDSRRARRLLLPQDAYVGKDLEKLGIPTEFLAAGGSFDALDVPVYYAEDGSWLGFTFGGLRFVVELEEAGAQHCDVLITGRSESAVTGDLVLFLGEEDAPGEYCVLVDEGTGVLVQVSPGGRLEISTP